MYLSPHEIEKLMLCNVGHLAQRRLARGLRLNHPEAVALIASVILELIRDGDHSVAQLMEMGRTLLGQRQVMPGIASLVPEVQVEGTFPDGTKLVSVHQPIHLQDGNLALALHGSFLPIPDAAAFEGAPECQTPGSVEFARETIAINEDRPSIALRVSNLGKRPIQVGSHYHFVEANQLLSFDRAKSYGKRLDIAAGTAIRFEAGETRVVHLVDIDGNKIIAGANGLASGPVSAQGLEIALRNIGERSYANVPEN